MTVLPWPRRQTGVAVAADGARYASFSFLPPSNIMLDVSVASSLRPAIAGGDCFPRMKRDGEKTRDSTKVSFARQSPGRSKLLTLAKGLCPSPHQIEEPRLIALSSSSTVCLRNDELSVSSCMQIFSP